MPKLPFLARGNSKVSGQLFYKRCRSDIEDAIQFLEEAKGRLSQKHDALFLLRISQAEKKLALGQHHDCIESLEQIRTDLEGHTDIDP